MTPAYVVQFTTPKKYILNGPWFGPKKPKKVIILLHGLTGSAFSMRSAVDSIAGGTTAVLAFNNRGFGQVNSIKRLKGKKGTYSIAGTAHEVFTDCADDIQGAVDLSKRSGAKKIYLLGHSTGCQKAIYWANKKRDLRVKGLFLLGPLSDYSGAVTEKGKAAIENGVAYAKRLIAAGKQHWLMPQHFSEWFVCDAQRYVSLYSPDSPEELFTYARPAVVPTAIRRVRMPTLVLLAGADEYGDKPAEEIAAWFDKNLKNKHKVVIVPKVGHSFKGAEKRVAKEIANFMKEA